MAMLDDTILWVATNGWEHCREELHAVLEGALSNEIPTPYDGLATQAALEVIKCKAARYNHKTDATLDELVAAKKELRRAGDLRIYWLSIRGHRGPHEN
jgi:hypothetical protein